MNHTHFLLEELKLKRGFWLICGQIFVHVLPIVYKVVCTHQEIRLQWPLLPANFLATVQYLLLVLHFIDAVLKFA